VEKTCIVYWSLRAIRNQTTEIQRVKIIPKLMQAGGIYWWNVSY
jgi:hypothetical protein